ncbi:ATP-binding protein [Streptomyces fagopyri]|uniref:ATP-binding protein n=1 Tax=Streptomyces fagopyri TaxID=2662397 RepID=UPI0033FD73DB
MDETSGADVGAASLLEASLALDSGSSRIAQARHLASAFLTTARDDHGIPVVTATVEIVQLIVSELVTNARKYAPGSAFLRLRVTRCCGASRALGQQSRRTCRQAPRSRTHRQHGLEIVRALAQAVTVERTPLALITAAT